MRKLVVFVLAALGLSLATRAQESKEARKESHKKYWKKVGTDTRDFWKGEHEKKVAKDKASNKQKDKPAKGPRKPPNPFRKKEKAS